MADNRITSVMGKEAAEGGSNLDLPTVAAKGSGSWKETEAVTPESSTGDSVTAMMGRLKLTSKEAKKFVLDVADEDAGGGPEWALVGKVLAPNVLHVNSISSIVKPAWGIPKGLMVHSCGANLFLAEFESEADLMRIMKGSP
jgi:hypothetical protein